jgi:hypothetical protein
MKEILSKEEQRSFFALSTNKDKDPFIRIFDSNKRIHPINAVMKHSLYLEIARLNHSCVPNAIWRFFNNIGRMTVRSVQAIQKGEEITINYPEKVLDYSQRQEALDFECLCQSCSKKGGEREQSENRLECISIHLMWTFCERLRKLVNPKLPEILAENHSRLSPEEKSLKRYDTATVLFHISEVLKLAAEEGIQPVILLACLYEAFDAAVVYGDGARGSVFAQLRYDAALISHGDDHPFTYQLDVYAYAPGQAVDDTSTQWISTKKIFRKD